MLKLLFALLVVALPSSAGADVVKDVFQCTTNPCVVRHSPGGNVELFTQAANALQARQWLLVIDGSCYSACAIAADQNRTTTCITERASFHFHKASVVREVQTASGIVSKEILWHFDPPQSHAIHMWNFERGGYLVEGFRKMSYQEALSFWNRCNFPSNGRGLY
jgi:hypothetical protein